MKKIKGKKINIKNIKGKMILLFSILILVSFVVVALISITGASKALTEAGERSLQLSAIDASDLIESKMETQLRTLLIGFLL